MMVYMTSRLETYFWNAPHLTVLSEGSPWHRSRQADGQDRVIEPVDGGQAASLHIPRLQ